MSVNRKRKDLDSGGSNGGGGHGGGGHGGSGFGYGGGPRGGDGWFGRNGFGSSSTGGPPIGGWQNKRPRTGDGFQGNFGNGGGSVHDWDRPFSPAPQTYSPSGSGGGSSYQQGGTQSAWRSGQSSHARKQNWKQHHPYTNAPSPGYYDGGLSGGNAYRYKPGLRSGGPGPSGFVPRRQPVSIPTPAPVAQYSTISMPSQQQSYPTPSPYAYSDGGAVTRNAQLQAATSVAVPLSQHIPIPLQTQPPPPPPIAPFGMPNAAPSVPYSLFGASSAAPIPSAPVPYPPQQYPYAAGTPSIPSNNHIAGYQQYHPPTQPHVPAPPAVSPPLPMPAPPIPSFSMFPYPNFSVAAPANPTHLPPFEHQQPPPQPPQQPLLPVPPPVQPPLPLPPSVSPPPPPPPFRAPPSVPASSSMATSKAPLPQPSPPARLTVTGDPLSSWPTKPKNPAKVILIPSTPKTKVQELYGASFSLLPPCLAPMQSLELVVFTLAFALNWAV